MTPRKRHTSLLGLTFAELQSLMEEASQPSYRAHQIYTGLYRRRIHTFDALTDVPKTFRKKLAASFSLARPDVQSVQASADGTRKYRFVAPDGAAFEAVYIPEVVPRGRTTNTLCISSQSGCSLGCRFCYTASLSQGMRDLSATEIVGQVMAVQDDVEAMQPAGSVTNVVFMGMGEPLLNYDAVTRAARILIDRTGLGFSSRRVTISTAGIVPAIRQLGRELPTQLAVSLNATTDAVRTRIMPINRKWPLTELTAAMREYPLAPHRRITVEYVLLGGLNDSLDDARRLPLLLAGIPVKVNLLPLNPHPRTDLLPPTSKQLQMFQATLHKAGLTVILRRPRGQDIAAACGQLGDDMTEQTPGRRQGSPNR